MAIYRAQIGFPFDTALPRDVFTLNPHYVGDNPQALADALKVNLIAQATVTTKPFTIKVYDAEKAPPSYPLATAQQTGTTPLSSIPRELSLCLSYYSQFNRKRWRGRMFIPAWAVSGASILARPTGAQMTACLTWRNTLGSLLPSNTNMVVYSKVDKVARVVTNWWVDDEWDIQRSRGTRGTTRQVAP